MSGQEEWRPIAWAPNYEVSSVGRVRSWLRRGGFSKPPVEPRIMSTRVNAKAGGYVIVDLQIDGAKATAYVHRLVLEAFKGSSFAGAEARHMDGNPTNNVPDNLEWGTSSENKADMVRHGTHTRGSRNGQARLSAEQVVAVRSGEEPSNVVAARLGVSQATICKIRKGRSYVVDLRALGHEPTRLGPPGPALCSENCGRSRQGNKKRCAECHVAWRRALLQECQVRYRARVRAERAAA